MATSAELFDKAKKYEDEGETELAEIVRARAVSTQQRERMASQATSAPSRNVVDLLTEQTQQAERKKEQIFDTAVGTRPTLEARAWAEEIATQKTLAQPLRAGVYNLDPAPAAATGFAMPLTREARPTTEADPWYTRLYEAAQLQPIMTAQQVSEALQQRERGEEAVIVPEAYGALLEGPLSGAFRLLSGVPTGIAQVADTYFDVAPAKQFFGTERITKPIDTAIRAVEEQLPEGRIKQAAVGPGPGLQFGDSYVGASPWLTAPRVAMAAIQDVGAKVLPDVVTAELDFIVDNTPQPVKSLVDFAKNGLLIAVPGNKGTAQADRQPVRLAVGSPALLPATMSSPQRANSPAAPAVDRQPSTAAGAYDRWVEDLAAGSNVGDRYMSDAKLRQAYKNTYGSESAAYWGGVGSEMFSPTGPGTAYRAGRAGVKAVLGGAVDTAVVRAATSAHFGAEAAKAGKTVDDAADAISQQVRDVVNPRAGEDPYDYLRRLNDARIAADAPTFRTTYAQAANHADGLERVREQLLPHMQGGWASPASRRILSSTDAASFNAAIDATPGLRANTAAARAALSPMLDIDPRTATQAARNQAVEAVYGRVKATLGASAPSDLKAVSSLVVVPREAAKRAVSSAATRVGKQMANLADPATSAATKQVLARFVPADGWISRLPDDLSTATVSQRARIADVLISDAVLRTVPGARNIRYALATDEFARSLVPTERLGRLSSDYAAIKARVGTLLQPAAFAAKVTAEPAAMRQAANELKNSLQGVEKTLTETLRSAMKATSSANADSAVAQVFVDARVRPEDVWSEIARVADPVRGGTGFLDDFAKANPGVTDIFPTFNNLTKYLNYIASVRPGYGIERAAEKTLDVMSDAMKTAISQKLVRDALDELAAVRPEYLVRLSAGPLVAAVSPERVAALTTDVLSAMIAQKTMWPNIVGKEANLGQEVAASVRQNLFSQGVRSSDITNPVAGADSLIKAFSEYSPMGPFVFPGVGVAGRQMQQLVQGAKGQRTIHELMRTAEGGGYLGAASDALRSVWQWGVASVNQGALAGRWVPNLRYHGQNIVTAPLIMLGTLGADYATASLGKLPMTVADAVKRTRGWVPPAGDAAFTARGIEYNEELLRKLEQRFNIGAANASEGLGRGLEEDIRAALRMQGWSSAINPASKSVYVRFAEETDIAFRREVFRRALRSGETPSAAATLARASIYDYNTIPPAARDFITKNLAFASFKAAALIDSVKAFDRGSSAYLKFARAQAEIQRTADPLGLSGDENLSRVYGVTGKYYDNPQNPESQYAIWGPSNPSVSALYDAMNLYTWANHTVMEQSLRPSAEFARRSLPFTETVKTAAALISGQDEKKTSSRVPAQYAASADLLLSAAGLNTTSYLTGQDGLGLGLNYLSSRAPYGPIPGLDVTVTAEPRMSAGGPVYYPAVFTMDRATAAKYYAWQTGLRVAGLKRLFDDSLKFGLSIDGLSEHVGPGVDLTQLRAPTPLGYATGLQTAAPAPSVDTALERYSQEKNRKLKR